MITINADELGNVLAAGRNIYGINTECELPVDFYQTFSTGKYLFLNGEVVAVEGWVAPVLQPLGL